MKNFYLSTSHKVMAKEKLKFTLLFALLLSGFLSIRAQSFTINAGSLNQTFFEGEIIYLSGNNPMPRIGYVSWFQISGFCGGLKLVQITKH